MAVSTAVGAGAEAILARAGSLPQEALHDDSVATIRLQQSRLTVKPQLTLRFGPCLHTRMTLGAVRLTPARQIDSPGTKHPGSIGCPVQFGVSIPGWAPS